MEYPGGQRYQEGKQHFEVKVKKTSRHRQQHTVVLSIQLASSLIYAPKWASAVS